MFKILVRKLLIKKKSYVCFPSKLISSTKASQWRVTVTWSDPLPEASTEGSSGVFHPGAVQSFPRRHSPVRLPTPQEI